MSIVKVVVEVEFEDGTDNTEELAVEYVNEAIGTGMDLMEGSVIPELLFMTVLDNVVKEETCQ